MSTAAATTALSPIPTVRDVPAAARDDFFLSFTQGQYWDSRPEIFKNPNRYHSVSRPAPRSPGDGRWLEAVDVTMWGDEHCTGVERHLPA